MDETEKIRELLDSPEFKQQFRDSLVEEARQTGTMLYYRDTKGRWVEEWPATGELYEVRRDTSTDTIVRIQTLHHPESVLS